MTDKLAHKLEEGLNTLGLACTETQQQQLLEFLQLLQKWNSAYNLVADDDLEHLLGRHLLDSLAVSPYLTTGRILDVGTGAGFPGLPLAILHTDSEFVLLDSNGKKTRFLFQVKLGLSLTNISVENCRIEHYQSNQQIDIVTCRAFSALSDIVAKTASLLDSGSRLLAMKGRYPEQEIEDLPAGVNVTKVVKLDVPETGAERHLIEISRAAS